MKKSEVMGINYSVCMCRMWRGLCRDECCRAPLLYRDYQETVLCYVCGQEQLTNQLIYIIPYVESRYSFVPKQFELPPRSPELVKVNGMTNYHQKLISPLLTTQRVDKNARQSQTPHSTFLSTSGTLDCQMFGDKCFHLDMRYIRVKGYGMDDTAHSYLSDTLNFTKPFNNNRVTMVALQTDGDGHCLVHAVSRALIGTELFWHPLRIGLLHHLNDNIDKYKTLLGMFIDNAEWGAIIEECDPEWKPNDGSMLGLRNVHIFGLANLLRRPIILLDCMAGINASADYAGVFLPGLNAPGDCSTNGVPNPPIVIAWASIARNHYVPLVPIRDSPLPRYPRDLLPKVWAFPQNFLDSYIKFDDQNCLVIGNGEEIGDTYVKQLTNILDEQFYDLHGIYPSLVSDIYYYQYTRKLLCSPKADQMTEVASGMLREKRLLRCLCCRGVCLVPINTLWLRPGGHLYELARKNFGDLIANQTYPFNKYGLSCIYDEDRDMLVVNAFNTKTPCNFCQCTRLRMINSDCSVQYRNGDITFDIVTDINKCRCKCGFKHYWAQTLYDNPPIQIPVDIKLLGTHVTENIIWFRDEEDESLNTNVLDMATRISQKYFSQESDANLQQVIESIVDHLEHLTTVYISSCFDVKGELEADEGVEERESRKREAESDPDDSPPTKYSPGENRETSDGDEATPIRRSARDNNPDGDSYEESTSTQSAESGRSSCSEEIEDIQQNNDYSHDELSTEKQSADIVEQSTDSVTQSTYNAVSSNDKQSTDSSQQLENKQSCDLITQSIEHKISQTSDINRSTNISKESTDQSVDSTEQCTDNVQTSTDSTLDKVISFDKTDISNVFSNSEVDNCEASTSSDIISTTFNDNVSPSTSR